MSDDKKNNQQDNSTEKQKTKSSFHDFIKNKTKETSNPQYLKDSIPFSGEKKVLND